MKSSLRWFYCSQIALLLAVFFVALCYVFLLSLGLGFTNQRYKLDFDAYRQIVDNPRLVDAFLTSVTLGVWTSLVAAPVAILVARQCLNISTDWLRLIVLVIFVLPLLSSSLLRMFGYSSMLSEGGILSNIGVMLLFPRDILFSEAATTIGLVSLVLPIGIVVVYLHLRSLGADIIASALNLGASKTQVFWRIEIPVCVSPVLMIVQVSILFALADTFSQSILGGNSVYTLAAALSDRIRIDDWRGASVIATLLVLLTGSVVAMILHIVPRLASKQ